MTTSNIKRTVFVAAACALTACSTDSPLAPATGVPERLTIARNGLSPLASFGDSAVLVTAVTDGEGKALSAVPLRWTVSAPDILEPLGAGVFRARANGTAVVRVQVDPSATGVRPGGYYADKLSDSIVVTVQQQPARIVPLSADSSFTLLGVTRTILVRITDARGNIVTAPLTPQWVSSNSAVVSVDDSGRATARGNGTATVSVRAGNASWTGNVSVNANRNHVSCMQYTQRKRAQQQCVTNSVTLRVAPERAP